jgi:hypothetical protein
MFKKNKYVVIKQAISKELAAFVANYFSIKKQVYDTCRQARFISPFETLLGEYEAAEGQIPHTYSNYADIAMETLMLKCQPEMEKVTGLKLYPAYTYARIYKHGDVLKRHKDRFSCEISTTMNLGGDEWPIYLNPDPKAGSVYGPKGGAHRVQDYKPTKDKGIKINLKPGDMLVYSGCELEHWREKFTGKECVQVFLHYNNKKTPGAKDNIFDRRPHLGLPSWFKR